MAMTPCKCQKSPWPVHGAAMAIPEAPPGMEEVGIWEAGAGMLLVHMAVPFDDAGAFTVPIGQGKPAGNGSVHPQSPHP
jgi:hypothetical protein